VRVWVKFCRKLVKSATETYKNLKFDFGEETAEFKHFIDFRVNDSGHSVLSKNDEN
jgi:hypothetical protein